MTSQSPPEAGEAPDEYRNAWASIQHLVMVEGASWSGREKNCAFLNLGERRFANVSGLSAANFPDDARAAAAVDWDDDGRLDLMVKNRTGPRLRFLRNTGPEEAGWLKLDLRGTECNRDAIGASVTVAAGGREYRQTLHAGEGYLSQSSKRLHFGLGEAASVERVSVRWPGGETEVFEGPALNGRYLLVQGTGTAEPVAARGHDFDAFEAQHETRFEGRADRAVLVAKLPMSAVTIPSFEDPKRKLKDYAGRPLLLNLWESTCAACLAEFGEFRERRAELEASGLALVPLTVDPAARHGDARRVLENFGLAGEGGYVDASLRSVLEVTFVEVFGRIEETALPTSLLFDQAGQLVAIYRGAIDVDRLLADVGTLSSLDPLRSTTEPLFGGRWYGEARRDFETLSRVFEELGRQRLSDLYGSLDEE